MAINSLEFIAFVAIVVLAYFLIPKKFKWVILLLASYIFYFSNSTMLIICILITTLSIYLVALEMQKIENKAKVQIENFKKKDNKIENRPETISVEPTEEKLKEDLKQQKKQIKQKAKRNKKVVLVIGILLNLGILAFLKYSNFFAENMNSLFSMLNINWNMGLFKFILPLGISYYTLQAISYIVDVYRGKIEADKNLGKVALFLAFFPQLIEGPIGRYDRLANQLYDPHKITYNNLTNGAQLMLWGYFKKMVIADRVAIYANEVFGNYANYSGPVIILGIIAYTVQIYTEFSAGIDIVRGTAQLFAINLDENFTRPFFAKSIDEFWRRWNITLGTWLKDYVFYPVSFSKLGMKISNFATSKFKKSYIRKIIPVFLPLLCVWLGNGFWHGSGWKYVTYGLYYFTIMMLGKILEPLGNRIIKLLKINTQAESYKVWQIIRTAIFVGFGMLIFRADTLIVAKDMFVSIFNTSNLAAMLTKSSLYLGGLRGIDLVVSFIGLGMVFITSLYKEAGHSVRGKLSQQNLLFRWLVFYGLILAIIIFGIYGQGYNVQNFIYGQF